MERTLDMIKEELYKIGIEILDNEVLDDYDYFSFSIGKHMEHEHILVIVKRIKTILNNKNTIYTLEINEIENVWELIGFYEKD